MKPLQSRYNSMIEMDLVPSTKSLPSILSKIQPEQLQIVDFKIVEGRRKYKLIWESKEGVMFKWQDFSNLRMIEEVVYNYEICNHKKIRAVEQEWTQYYLQGMVKKPYIYLDIETMRKYYSEPSEDSDSSFCVNHSKKPKYKAMDFEILPNFSPNQRRKRKTIKKSNRKPCIKDTPKYKTKVKHHQHTFNEDSNKRSEEALESLEEFSESSSWSRIIEPCIRELNVKEVKEEESNKENIEPPRSRREGVIEAEEQQSETINLKRQEIKRVCHEAIEKAQQKIQTKQNKVDHQQGQEDQIDIPLQDQVSSVFSDRAREELATPLNIFSEESNAVPLIEHALIESESSSLNNLHRSNVRSFLMQEMKKLNIDTSFIENAPKKEDWEQQKTTFQRITDSPIRGNFQINQTPRQTVPVNQVNFEKLLTKIEQIQQSTQDRRCECSIQQYISSRILPFVPKITKASPKILKINGYFRFKNLNLYSVNTGTAYDFQQMFTIRQTLIVLCPQLLQNFNEQNRQTSQNPDKIDL